MAVTNNLIDKSKEPLMGANGTSETEHCLKERPKLLIYKIRINDLKINNLQPD